MRSLFLFAWLATLLAMALTLAACSAREQPGRYQMVVIQPTPANEEVLLIMDTATGDGKLFYGKSVQSFSYSREEYSGKRDMDTVEEQK